jgi:hypothetical protein
MVTEWTNTKMNQTAKNTVVNVIVYKAKAM